MFISYGLYVLCPFYLYSNYVLILISVTFVCPTEIIAFSERINEFKALDTQVLGCSVDSAFSHLAWINQPRKEGGIGALTYPLLADLTKSISKNYGVLGNHDVIYLIR